MSTRKTCPDNETLISFLYDEFEPGAQPDRTAVERHLGECRTCADQVASLGSVRTQLAAWTTPEAELGLSVVRATPSSGVVPGRFGRLGDWSRSRLPLAAAAVLVIGAALGLARLDIQHDGTRFAVRTGWGHASASGASLSPAAAAAATPIDVAALQRELASLRDQVTQLRKTAGAGVSATVASMPASRPAGPSGDALLREFKRLLDESEIRQQQNLQLRIGEVTRDFEMARRADLVQIEQGFGRLGRQRQEDVINQQRLLQQLQRTVSTQPPQE